MTPEDQLIQAIAQRAELTLDAARRAYQAMQALAHEIVPFQASLPRRHLFNRLVEHTSTKLC